jgi:hypothetical protein
MEAYKYSYSSPSPSHHLTLMLDHVAESEPGRFYEKNMFSDFFLF